ncbi:MAG: glycosyltransferase, partial [Nitrospinota bacterium]
AKPEIRARRRKALQIADHQILVMTVGRITREKGVFELIEAITLAAERDPRIVCVLVGAKPAFDETAAVQRCLAQIPALKGRIRLLPASPPDKVWEYLCAADLFAFTSHHEGMPNSLLEAMSMGIPAVAFAIPPVREIANGTDGVVTVPPFDVVRLAEAMLRLAVSPAERMRIGKQGQALVKERFLVQQNMAVALKHLAQIGPQDSA